MNRALLSMMLLVAVGCTSASEKAKLDAFRHLRDGDRDAAVESLEPCLEQGEPEEQFLCRGMVGEIRFRQRRWADAAAAHRDAFRIRDRIAIERGYGAPSADSLFELGWSLYQLGDLAAAESVLARTRKEAHASVEGYGESKLMIAATDLALADIYGELGDAEAAARHREEARLNACAADELEYFVDGTGPRLYAHHFPAEIFIHLGDACPDPDASRLLYLHARDQALRRGEDDAVQRARERIFSGSSGSNRDPGGTRPSVVLARSTAGGRALRTCDAPPPRRRIRGVPPLS